MKSTFHDPTRRLLGEMRLYRPEHTIHRMLVQCFEKHQQPPFCWKFVIIDESDVVPFRLLNGSIARQCYVLAALDAVGDRNGGTRRQGLDDRLRRFELVVIYNYDRKRKS